MEYQHLYLLLSTISICLLILRKRPFDLFFMAFVFVLLYTAPLFLGYLPGNLYLYEKGVRQELYNSFFIVQAALVLTGWFADIIIKPLNLRYSYTRIDLTSYKNLFNTCFLIFSLVFILQVITVGIDFSRKSDALASGGVNLLILEVMSVLLFSVAMQLKTFIRTLLAVICLLIIFFVFGLRSVIVLGGLSFLILKAFTVTDKRGKWLAYSFVGGVLGVIVVTLMKPFYGFIINDEMAFNDLILNLSQWGFFLSRFEFMLTQHIFNEVVLQGFSIPITSVPAGLLNILPLPGSIIGVSSSEFNTLFQSRLFPGVPYGMAYNFWAEAYSWGGYFGVGIYALIYSLFIFFIQLLLQNLLNKNSIFVPLVAIIACLLVFYIHRNSLGSILAYIRNYMYPFFFIIIIDYFMRKFLKGCTR